MINVVSPNRDAFTENKRGVQLRGQLFQTVALIYYCFFANGGAAISETKLNC